MRALDQVDALKTELPILGELTAGDFEEARRATLPAGPSSVEAVTADLVGYLRGMTLFGHPRTQQNVIPPPTIPSVIGVLLAALHNPNIAWGRIQPAGGPGRSGGRGHDRGAHRLRP